MDKNKIFSDIDNQIYNLGTVFGTKTDRFDEFMHLEKIDSKITSIKRMYYLYLGLSIILGGFLFITGFFQIFDFKLFDLSKSGLIIVLAFGNISMMIIHKIDLEKLKMIKYLLQLKQMVENE